MKELPEGQGWITSGKEDEDFTKKEEMKMLLMLTPINEVLQANNEENAPKKIENQMSAIYILRPGSLVVYNPPPPPPPPPFRSGRFKLPEGWEVEEVPRADASRIDKVHGPGADLDTLCVGPYNVRLEECFSSLHKILAKMDEVTNLQTIMDSYVPVMKFKLQGILIDLVYAPIYLRVFPNVSVRTTF
nr:PREDICTED: uncharacterized protein LOC108194907 [Daucus carota subsp. sativus]